MQSFLQYRRFGRLVRRQIEQDSHKHAATAVDRGDSSSPSSEPATAADKDLEKAAESSDGRESCEGRESVELDEHVDEEGLQGAPSGLALGEESKETESRRLSRGHTLSRTSTLATQHTLGTRLGTTLTGVDVRDRTTHEGGDRSRQVFVVGFRGDDDALNPHNWSRWTRVGATINVAGVGAVVGLASSIDSSALLQAAHDFGVSPVVESLATGIFLMGFGVGALFAGPVSETVGRNPIYISTLLLYMIFVMASGLAPNIGAQLVFRFLAGFFGSTPLTCGGGSVADMWDPLERVYTFPVFANAAFMGPILGPVIGGWVVQSPYLAWRWTEWFTLIISGLVLVCIVLFQPETYAPVLLKWKAEHLRKITGDDRYAAPMEIREETFLHRLQQALYRPFIMTAREPIIGLFGLYLTVIYIILFTFLDGYDFIYGSTGRIYNFGPGLTGTCFVGIAIGLCGASGLVPLIYRWAQRELQKVKEHGGGRLPPEFRLWYAMLGGAAAIPVSLFWMGWTAYPSISVWSPLAASVLFGFGILCVFISSYQYLIDAYEVYAASALASVTLIRYLAAGGMVIVGVPFYSNLGVHWTLTIMGAISLLMVPVPYLFYFYGTKIRRRSKYAAVHDEPQST